MTNPARDRLAIAECGAKHIRLSEPQQGHSLAAATEARSTHVRKAVGILADGFDTAQLARDFPPLFEPRWEREVPHEDELHSLTSRAAWDLVCVWLLARAAGGVDSRTGLEEAEAWFAGATDVGARPLSTAAAPSVLEQARRELADVPIDQDFWDLLPYVLDQHGPGSRASVLRDPSTKAARAAKKKEGLFYTPADVADFMVGAALANYTGDITSPKCLDPACGTGVFLLSLCRIAEQRAARGAQFDRFRFVTRCLYGCDLSRQSVDACTFVLLHHCLAGALAKCASPWAAWHAIRLNLAVVDSFHLRRPGPGVATTPPGSSPREARKQALVEARVRSLDCVSEPLSDQNLYVVGGGFLPGRRVIQLGELFAEAADGFDVLVANPPYASLGQRPDYDLLSSEFNSLGRARPGGRDNTFPLFIEMMWRLTAPGQNSSAMVVPLSIAYGTGPQYQDCRRAMAREGGRWQFAFFDREPHALFGEEVKTRNAVLFRSEGRSTPPRDHPAAVATGPLRKWTSRTRTQLLQSIEFTKLGAVDITRGIPKLDGHLQLEAYCRLRRAEATLRSLCARMGKCSVQAALSPQDTHRVYVGGTAYNFLNVFRRVSAEQASDFPLTRSAIHCLEFATAREAAAAFALLSSRLVFWLWRVEGDGFHVTSSFLQAVPFHRDSFTSSEMTRLSALGHELWRAVEPSRFASVNRGRTSYTFRPLSCEKERDDIDSLLITAASLPPDFGVELRSFVRATVVVDEEDRTRHHLKDYFREQ